MNSTTTTIFEKVSKAGAITPTILNGLPGMSSLEIAEITGKRHDNILRDIAKMLVELDLIDALKSEDVNVLQTESGKFLQTQYKDAKGESRPLSILNKELTFTLLSRYSFKLSNLIVKRWINLEESGFERVSVQNTVVHLVEREKDNRQAALRLLKKGSRRCLSPAQKEQQRWTRIAQRCDKERDVY